MLALGSVGDVFKMLDHLLAPLVLALVLGDRAEDAFRQNSAAEREAEQTLLPFARERGIAVIANRPFAGGDVFRRLRHQPLPPWAAEIDCTTWAQLLLKFVVSHPAMTCAIPATARMDHLRENMQAGYGRMPDEAMRTLIAAQVI